MNIQLIITVFVAFAAFGGAWTLQDWRYGAKEAEHAEQELVNQQLAAKAIVRRLDNTIQAQNDAQGRAVVLRADAIGARQSLDRLRSATDLALRTAAVSQSACLERAAAIADVLQRSTERYRGLGEVCDRHVSDLKTLIDSFPARSEKVP